VCIVYSYILHRIDLQRAITHAEKLDYLKTQRKQNRNLEELKTKLNKIEKSVVNITLILGVGDI
jgi:hypothetical protein